MATPDVMVPHGGHGSEVSTDTEWSKNIDFRDRWSRWLVREMLAKVYSRTSDDSLPPDIHRLLPDVSSNKIPAENIPELPKFEPKDSLPAEMKVCIVGAGVAGLFTAMILDWLKEKCKTEKKLSDLNISYDMFEANGKDRLGGRLYTYKFPPTGRYTPGDHDYYDVSAMGFPDIPIMKRLVTHNINSF